MSQQTLDLRRSMQILRRRRLIVGLVVLLGLLLGAAFAVLRPPTLTSRALVVLPNSTSSISTQVVIATSDPVLELALPDISPSMSVTGLRSKVQAQSLTNYIISVSAKGKTAAQAENTANAVAYSYVVYVGSPANPLGRVPARILQKATNATGTSPLRRLIIDALIGAGAGLLIGIIAVLGISRRDRRMVLRDEIANSIGVAVVASFPVARPDNAAGWGKLLEEYQPEPLNAWHLRTALQQLGMAVNSPSNADDGASSSLAVVSLASDRGALALGPQLAVFAASLGIPTVLLIGPQQDTNATATLRAACTAPPSSKRSSLLRVVVSDDSFFGEQADATLTVAVIVVDDRTPRVPDLTTRTGTTVLGVSAGAVTAEQLARAAMSTAVDGRELAGILVANPEETDRTTGRLPQLTRPRRRRLPTRLRSMTMEIRR
jgi:capsular polysaccharide biosynthesis protein